MTPTVLDEDNVRVDRSYDDHLDMKEVKDNEWHYVDGDEESDKYNELFDAFDDENLMKIPPPGCFQIARQQKISLNLI
jgi:hypothetical protein